MEFVLQPGLGCLSSFTEYLSKNEFDILVEFDAEAERCIFGFLFRC